MTLLWSNNASTTISGSITAAATSVSLSAGTGASFPSPTGGNYFKATFYDQATKSIYEIVHVTARTGDVCTITRAQEGTTAQAWNAGDIFANLVTAGTLNQFVQAGTGPANTSVVYVGTDTSVTPNTIIANTNPVPPSLAIGMLFTIKVANTNSGPTQLQLNGNAGIYVKRTDGSDLVGGNVVAGQEYVFVFNGTNFNATTPPIPTQPPQTVFYVRQTGNDNNSGFANTDAQAFATPQGAINAIKKRYISQNTITVRIADGSYLGGFNDSTSYIASWDFIGNTSTPGNVIIDATSTNPASYVVPGMVPGICVLATGTANITVSGCTFKSYYANASAQYGGYLTIQMCGFNSPLSGDAPIGAAWRGFIYMGGAPPGGTDVSTFNGSAPCDSLMHSTGASNIQLGSYTIYGSSNLVMSLSGSSLSFSSGILHAEANGTIVMTTSPGVVNFSTTSTPSGPQFTAITGGGVAGTSVLNSVTSAAGNVTAPGWAQS